MSGDLKINQWKAAMEDEGSFLKDWNKAASLDSSLFRRAGTLPRHAVTLELDYHEGRLVSIETKGFPSARGRTGLRSEGHLEAVKNQCCRYECFRSDKVTVSKVSIRVK